MNIGSQFLKRLLISMLKIYLNEKIKLQSTKIENRISLYGDMDFPKALLVKLLKGPFVISYFLKFIAKNPNIFFRILKILQNFAKIAEL